MEMGAFGVTAQVSQEIPTEAELGRLVVEALYRLRKTLKAG